MADWCMLEGIFTINLITSAIAQSDYMSGKEPGKIAAAVLDADNARTVQRQARDHRQTDFVGELRDVVEHDVNRRAPRQFAKPMFDALLAHLIVVGTGDGNRRTTEISLSATGLKDHG